MPTFTYADKCKGEGKCVEICPSGVRAINAGTGKAFTTEPNFCWECYSCVKACPEGAIDVRGYSDMAPLNHRVTVARDTAERMIQWEIVYRNGLVTKQYEFPIRTVPWGSFEPNNHDNGSLDITDQRLSHENSKEVRRPDPEQHRIMKEAE